MSEKRIELNSTLAYVYAASGKTQAVDNLEGVVDLDHTLYKRVYSEDDMAKYNSGEMSFEQLKSRPNTTHPNWPNNFTDDVINMLAGKSSVAGNSAVLVPFTKEIVEACQTALDRRKISCRELLIVPERKNFPEVIKLFERRGNDEKYIADRIRDFPGLMDYASEIGDKRVPKITMRSGQYLTGVLAGRGIPRKPEVLASVEWFIGKNPNLDIGVEQLNSMHTKNPFGLHLDVMRPGGCAAPEPRMTDEQYHNVIGKAKLPIDAHLMIPNPEHSLCHYLSGKLRSLCFQVEHARDAVSIGNLLKIIKNTGVDAGICIDAPTKIDNTLAGIIGDCDTVTLMTIVAGKSGSPIDLSAVDKIKQVRRINPAATIITDGGLRFDDNLPRLAQADRFVGASAIFGKEYDNTTTKNNIDALHSNLVKHRVR